MALFFNYSDVNCKLKVWEITEPVEFFTQHLSLSLAEEQQLEKLKLAQRRYEFVVTRFLLKALGLPSQTLQYETTGKPKPIGDKRISISHCNGYVAVLISDKGEPGIDIENISSRPLKISTRYLSESEIKSVSGDKTLATLLWSAKEAQFKMCKRQGVNFKENLRVKISDDKGGRLMSSILKEEKEVQVELSYKIFEKNVLVWGVNYEDI